MCNPSGKVSKSQRRLTRSERSFYNELHRLADRMKPRVNRAVREMMNQLKRDLSLTQLGNALELGSTFGVMQQVPLDKIERYMQPVMDDLTRLVHQAAQHSIQLLPNKLLQKATLNVDMSFDLINAATVRFLQQYKMQLIRSVTDATRSGLRSIIRMGQTQGLTVRQQAMRIRNLIGLTPRQIDALDRKRRNLLSNGWTKLDAEDKVLRMAIKQHRERAEMIARTETIRAANMGQQQLWEQAKEQDLLEPDVKQVWIVTDDDRLCQVCEPIPSMNEGGVAIDGLFNTPVGRLSGPPAHPRCRCSLGIG